MQQELRILVVDDDEQVAATLRIYFERAGHQVRTATSAFEALDCAEDFRPELVIVDYSMPAVGGLETVDALRQIVDGFACIMMTGEDLDAVLPEASRIGIQQVIGKPFSLSALGRLLRLPHKELVLKPVEDGVAEPRCSAFSGLGDRRRVNIPQFPHRLADGTLLMADRRRRERRRYPQNPDPPPTMP